VGHHPLARTTHNVSGIWGMKHTRLAQQKQLQMLGANTWRLRKGMLAVLYYIHLLCWPSPVMHCCTSAGRTFLGTPCNNQWQMSNVIHM
jgi:hypothetical protein